MREYSKLRPISKLEQQAEANMKTKLLLSDNHNIIQTYLNHNGANFKVVNPVGEQECDILCRQINIEKANYAFVYKSDLKKGLRDDLWIGLVLFVDCQKALITHFQALFGQDQISYSQTQKSRIQSMESI